MAISAERSSCLIKVLTLLTGAAMMLLGILRFVFVTDIRILDGIWTVYWIIFGLVLILVELKVQFIVNYVEFLVDYCGKGMFIIFCGTLLINSFSGDQAIYSIIGLLIVGVGFVLIWLGFAAAPAAQLPVPQK